MPKQPDDATLKVMTVLDAIQTDSQFEAFMANVRMLWEAKKLALAKIAGAPSRTDH